LSQREHQCRKCAPKLPYHCPELTQHQCLPLPLTCSFCGFFKAWRRHAVPIEEENVVLDPDTAHCELVVSDSGKSVKHSDTPQDSPYNPKRFNLRTCVLGHDGFSSGRHYWEVEVAYAGEWVVGIFGENVERKGDIEFKPEKGIWAVGKRAVFLKAFTSPRHTLFPEIKAPRRIRVSLDYEGGRVSFFSVDEGIHIYTFSQASFGGKKVYPWFWVGPETCLKIWP
ncbi:butyrophilin subfamily 3 member A3-like, partial [Myiozetetes cayanensis]|uniref:butyrophilin subfamily 3 member A3-like n=1 Tax=Myiozetetes cayanensis TaxID=478635 RepID=UPI00215E4C0B